MKHKSILFEIKDQIGRYNQLNDLIKSNFKNVQSLNVSYIKQVNSLLNAILIQKCSRNKWSTSDVKLYFECQTERKYDQLTDGIYLYGFKMIGGVYDEPSKTVKHTELVTT